MFGKAEKEEIVSLEKLSKREIIIFVPITALIFIFGIYATPLLDITQWLKNNIINITEFHQNKNTVSQIAALKDWGFIKWIYMGYLVKSF